MKKTVYLIKDEGNNYSFESLVEIHESESNAKDRLQELKEQSVMQNYWIEEGELHLA